MLGAHLRLHARDSEPQRLDQMLNSLVPVWPSGSGVILVEFDGALPTSWPAGLLELQSTILLVPDTENHPELLSLAKGAAPNLCMRYGERGDSAGLNATYQAVYREEIPLLQHLAGRPPLQNVLALDLDEPIDHARATHAGSFATSGWSCARWKRRPADKKVGMLSTILKLIQLIDKDADTADIETILKRDAVLSYKLISMANSAAYGLAVEVTSIRHALNLLGRHKLKRWLSLLLLHSGGPDTPQVLLQLAFVRATFLERLGSAMEFGGDQDDLFLCGAFSLLDKILGIPLTELLGRISISDGITDALVGDEGPLAPLLGVVRGLEARDPAFLDVQCEKLAVDPGVVSRALLGALSASRELATG